jgi:hypothetical protein
VVGATARVEGMESDDTLVISDRSLDVGAALLEVDRRVVVGAFDVVVSTSSVSDGVEVEVALTGGATAAVVVVGLLVDSGPPVKPLGVMVT